MITGDISLRDVAFVVCTALHKKGVRAVLTGGSAATFYAPGAHQSADLDYVLDWSSEQQLVDQALLELGFTKQGRSYAHPLNPFTLDFPPGPLGIGDDFDVDVATYREGEALLHVISATDSVRDRLAAFIHWRDFAGLRQAVAVASAHPTDIEKVRAWCTEENAVAEFEMFTQQLELRREAD